MVRNYKSRLKKDAKDGLRRGDALLKLIEIQKEQVMISKYEAR
jgi:hypothetical protein